MSDLDNAIQELASEQLAYGGPARNQYWPVVMFRDPDFEVHMPSLSNATGMLHETANNRFSRKVWLKNVGEEHLVLTATANDCEVEVTPYLRPHGKGELTMTHTIDNPLVESVTSTFMLHVEKVQKNESHPDEPEYHVHWPLQLYADPECELPFRSIQEASMAIPLVSRPDKQSATRRLYIRNAGKEHLLVFLTPTNPSMEVKMLPNIHLGPGAVRAIEFNYSGNIRNGESIETGCRMDAEIISAESEHLPGLRQEVMNE